MTERLRTHRFNN